MKKFAVLAAVLILFGLAAAPAKACDPIAGVSFGFQANAFTGGFAVVQPAFVQSSFGVQAFVQPSFGFLAVPRFVPAVTVVRQRAVVVAPVVRTRVVVRAPRAAVVRQRTVIRR